MNFLYPTRFYNGTNELLKNCFVRVKLHFSNIMAKPLQKSTSYMKYEIVLEIANTAQMVEKN